MIHEQFSILHEFHVHEPSNLIFDIALCCMVSAGMLWIAVAVSVACTTSRLVPPSSKWDGSAVHLPTRFVYSLIFLMSFLVYFLHNHTMQSL